jgi:DNA-binding FrmR family transcriptional regulator
MKKIQKSIRQLADKSQNSSSENQVFKARINRIIGQIKGIERMVENNRSCEEILQQINAIKKAIDGLSKEIVISDICRIVPQDKTQVVTKMVERAISL